MASSHPRKGSTPAKLPYSAKKATLKRNTSILNFFQKSDAPTSRQPRITQFATKSGRNDKNIGVSHSGKGRGDAGESLFLEDSDDRASPVDVETPLGDVDNENEDGIIGGKRRSSNVYSDLDSESELGFLRTDENGTPKRRKGNDSQSEEDEKKKKKPAVPRQNGPFIDESDEEDFEALRDAHDIPAIETAERTQQPAIPVPVPSLVREATSHVEDDELADFDEIEENEFREEEFLEPLVDGHEGGEEETAVNGCPVCQTSLAGLNETVSSTACGERY